jgi:hypothetical protein
LTSKQMNRYRMSVTDKKGYFVFPALSPGTHYLYIERASLDENYIPAMDMPLTLTVEEQKKQEVQINIVEGSSISGRIVLYKFIKEGQQFIIEEEEDDESKEEEELIEDSGIPNLIIEISQGDITKRRITDKDGEFDFKELTPGNWTLKCLSPLPFENHYYEKDSFEIILETGDHQVITINVKPKKRTIQMLDQEETLTVE